MSRVRVLVVDDSAAARRLLTEAFAGDDAVEVVGTASNGKIALERVTQLAPDVVTLDVEMPVLDGISTLIELRKTHPRLPVIMFSPLTERAAAVTLDALGHGATAYATKPAAANFTEAIAEVRRDLVSKAKHFGAAFRRPEAARPPAARPASRATAPVEVVAIAASTGGPNALHLVLEGLPRQFPVPLLLVQHMPPVFTRVLAERLSRVSPAPVAEGVDGEAVTRERALIAPGDFHLTVARRAAGVVVRLNQEAQENSCRPAADVLFRSVAEAFGPAALAVVLTGMGRDGLRGCERIKEAGGQVLAQDEASSVVWGMPGFVARAGLADEVLPLDELAAAIGRRVAPPNFQRWGETA